MGLIYWKARQVHVWLGHPGSTHSDRTDAEVATHVIGKLGRAHQEQRSPGHCSDALAVLDEIEFWQWECVHTLFRRPWFSRVWDVQELGLCRDALFQCEEDSFTLYELDHFLLSLFSRKLPILDIHTLNLRLVLLASRYRAATMNEMHIMSTSPSCDFLDILDAARDLQCTYVRDSIYMLFLDTHQQRRS
jgi:hypothetical protein